MSSIFVLSTLDLLSTPMCFLYGITEAEHNNFSLVTLKAQMKFS